MEVTPRLRRRHHLERCVRTISSGNTDCLIFQRRASIGAQTINSITPAQAASKPRHNSTAAWQFGGTSLAGTADLWLRLGHSRRTTRPCGILASLTRSGRARARTSQSNTHRHRSRLTHGLVRPLRASTVKPAWIGSPKANGTHSLPLNLTP